MKIGNRKIRENFLSESDGFSSKPEVVAYESKSDIFTAHPVIFVDPLTEYLFFFLAQSSFYPSHRKVRLRFA